MKSLRSRRRSPLLGVLFLLSCAIRFSDSNTTPDITYPASTYQAAATISTLNEKPQPSTDVPTANPTTITTTIRSTSVDVTRNTNVRSVSQITSSNGGLTSSLTTTETLPSPSSTSGGSRSPVQSVNLPHTITTSTSVLAADPFDIREPISNQPEANQENTDERPPSSSSVGEPDNILPSTSSVLIKPLQPTNTNPSVSTSNSIPTRIMNQSAIVEASTVSPSTIHEALINDVHVEKKLKNGLYRIKLAEIITDQFNGGINQQPDTMNYMPPRNLNEHGIANGGKINIIDLYPLKVEDFNPIIKNSNEKLIREKGIYFEDPSSSRHRNDDSTMLNDDRNMLPNSLDALFKSDSNSIGPSIKIPSVNRQKGEISDFTGKLLQEKDGVITEIEKKFRLNEFEQSTSTPTPTLAPASSSLSATQKPLQASTLRIYKPKLQVNHQIQFIERRVKKSFEFPLHREAASRFGFANTKFNSDAAKLDTGESRPSDAHPEFSTTKFYNSKELHSEMLQRRKSSSATESATSYHQPPPPGRVSSPPMDATSTASALTTRTLPTIDSTKAVLIEKFTPTADAAHSSTTTVTATTASDRFNTSNERAKVLKRVKVELEKNTGPQVMVIPSVEREQKSLTDPSANEEKSSASLSLPVSNDKMNSTPVMAAQPTTSDTMTTRGKEEINSTPTTTLLTSTTIQWQSSSYSPSYSTVESNERSTSPTKNSKSKPISRPRILSRLQEKINSLDCDIQGLPQESHLWRGNETHELMLPIVTPESCKSSNDCTPMRISWEGNAEIQSGDVLLVEINDAMLYSTYQPKVNSGHTTQVYQVTRSGHEHCDVTEGILLDITPLVVDGRKLVTLYDKDLTEGINLLIVVSEQWGAQCIRLKVTMKSDNCGENADCSGKGVCYSNESMEGYECQCCGGFTGSHCEEIDACSPSPCTNNGICVDLSQGHEGNAYQCLCPYGYTGKNCQYESDPCNPAECMNGGSCVGNSSHFTCDCAPGYTGPLCQHNLNECESSPCVHGICVDQEDGFRCFCQPGFAGELCNFEYNECESNPCQNGAECIDQIGSFECRCSKGYIGSRCEIKVDFCANKPCPEGHQCIDHGDDFSCECPGGRNGPDCNQIPRTQCNVNPCTHGGTCWSSGDSFYCACRPGFTGAMCEDEFVVETVVSSSEFMVDDTSARNFNDKAFGSVVLKSPIELHNAYIAAGVLAAAIFIVAVVVTICHCKVNQTYRKFSTRTTPFLPILGFGRRGKTQKSHKHWLSGKAGSGSSSSSNCNPLKSGRGHVPATGPHQYHNHSTTGLQQPPQQIHERPFQRHLAMNLENDMYYTVDFSEHSQHSPLIQ